MNLSEVKDVAAIVGTVIAVPGLLFAAVKTWRELKRLREQREAEVEERKRSNEQRQTELERRRIEFTLAQHRRLFDDKVLCSVLERLDGDPPELGEESMAESKRKFLTFFEEMIPLRNSGYIANDVAMYMFGYYATCARNGENFMAGMSQAPADWGIFFQFAEAYEQKRGETDPGKVRF